MRAVGLLVCCGVAWAQTVEPAHEPLERAYSALAARDYDTAIAGFLQAEAAAPGRASIHKDLAYAYLKVGESELARDEFGAALELEPEDTHTALEYAFLCYETRKQVEARRIFDRLRKSGDATAEAAFQNIDRPLAAGIERWKRAIAMGADSFSDHFELATLAEQRDELELAAEHYEKAWRILPDRRSVLLDLGRVWQQLGRTDAALAALLAASRGGEARAAEQARELLPDRYPYISEFRHALEFDPGNVELRRELGFLLLRMGLQAEAEQEFETLTESAPDDLLSATQLGFLFYARGDRASAMPLFDRVLVGGDEELANRVRAVLRMEQVLEPRPQTTPVVDAKEMAERSIKAGYLKDAAKYLEMAHEAEPGNPAVMLKLGWAYNLLHQDVAAYSWFDRARQGTDPMIAAEASRAWHNLHGAFARFRTSGWVFPTFSTRWHDLFSYGQIKTEVRTGLPLRPYVSLRFIGDTRVELAGALPQYLSESSFILGAGLATSTWHGLMAWAEAGSAASYVTGHWLPDYRGGVSFSRTFGAALAGDSSGLFLSSNTDAVFLSRFGNDWLGYQQTRLGWTGEWKRLRAQIYWNANVTVDVQRQGWANFIELGPGIRFRPPWVPSSVFLTADLMRGAYLIHGSFPQSTFSDVRVGLWYAFSF